MEAASAAGAGGKDAPPPTTEAVCGVRGVAGNWVSAGDREFAGSNLADDLLSHRLTPVLSVLGPSPGPCGLPGRSGPKVGGAGASLYGDHLLRTGLSGVMVSLTGPADGNDPPAAALDSLEIGGAFATFLGRPTDLRVLVGMAGADAVASIATVTAGSESAAAIVTTVPDLMDVTGRLGGRTCWDALVKRGRLTAGVLRVGGGHTQLVTVPSALGGFNVSFTERPRPSWSASIAHAASDSRRYSSGSHCDVPALARPGLTVAGAPM